MSHAEPKPAAERHPPGDAAPARRAEATVLLEPLAPSSGSTLLETPDGAAVFGWRVDGRVQALFPRERLRTDFCMRLAGETRGFFLMKSLAGTPDTLTLPWHEIRAKLGPAYGGSGGARVEWQVCLALAAGAPLFTSRAFDLLLAAPRDPRARRRPGRLT